MAEPPKPTADNVLPEETVVNGTFRWTIINFSRMEAGKRHYSDVFHIGRTKWQVLLLGRTDIGDLSMYLRNAENLDFGWSRHARFSLRIISQLRPELSHKKDASFKYHKRVTDWGFKSYISFKTLMNPEKGYLQHDTLIIEAEVHVSKIIGYLKSVPPELLREGAGYGQALRNSVDFSSPQQHLPITGSHIPADSFSTPFGTGPFGTGGNGTGSNGSSTFFPTVFKSPEALGWSDMSIQEALEKKKKMGEEKVKNLQKIADKLNAEVAAVEKKMEVLKQSLKTAQQNAKVAQQELMAAKKTASEEFEVAREAIISQRKKVEEEFRRLRSLVLPEGGGSPQTPTDPVCPTNISSINTSITMTGNNTLRGICVEDRSTERSMARSMERSSEVRVGENEELAISVGGQNLRREREESERDVFPGRPDVPIINSVNGRVGEGREGEGNELEESLEDRPLAFLAAEMAGYPRSGGGRNNNSNNGNSNTGEINHATGEEVEMEKEMENLSGEGEGEGGIAVGSTGWWQNVAGVAAELVSQFNMGTLKRSREVEEQLEKFEEAAKRLKAQQDLC